MSRLQIIKAPSKTARKIKLVVFDFDGVLTDNTVWTLVNGEEAIRCWRGDGIGLSRLKKVGVAAWVLSTEKNRIVETRCKKLNIPCIQGLEDKEKGLMVISKKLNIPVSQTAYVGNDVNDLGCLLKVGLPIVVADAYDEVKKVAKFITNKPGGMGAVREVCDWIISSKFKMK